MRSLPFLPIALLSVFAFQTPAQTPPSLGADHPPDFRTNARAVLVDVVVTDSHGNPVSGLRQQDFKLTENGKPEPVVFFEEHKGTAAVPIEIPKMPPNVFTNVPVAPQADALNVLLLDALNTPEQDQSYVRAQVLDFLKTMKPGTPLAVFSLSTDLRLVQGFTGSPSTLLASLQDKKYGVRPETTAFAHSTKNDLDDKEEVWRRQMMLGAHHTDAGITALIQDQQNEKAYKAVQRVTMTAEVLEIIARYLARIPGRKNLIWFASRFPMAFFPVANGNGALAVGRKTGGLEPAENFQIQTGKLKETADLLTVSRVAIYPVGARGVETFIGGQADVPYQGDVPVKIPEEAEMLANYRIMGELASETGGERISGTNDLSKAIAHAIDNSSHFYTLSYTPSNKNLDGQFRSIEVRIPEAKYTLAYRRGYFALDSAQAPGRSKDAPKEKSAANPNPMQSLMMYGAPSSTEILYGARVISVDPQPAPNAARAGKNAKLAAPTKRYAVDLMIRSTDVKLQSAADGKHTGKVQVELLAYDRDGHPLNWQGGTLAMNLAPDVYAAIQRSGVPAHFDIDLPSDKDVFLATGVYDWESGKAGTLEIPITAAEVAVTQTH